MWVQTASSQKDVPFMGQPKMAQTFLDLFGGTFFWRKKHQPSGHQLSKINPIFSPVATPPQKKNKGAQNYNSSK